MTLSYARWIGARGSASLILVCTVLVGGCVDDGSSTKAGGEAAPITLRIGTPDAQGTAGADQLEDFARRVDALSEGDVRVEPVWAAGVGDDWDQQVARSVVSGELDMGHIPARSWDTEGVATLRALHAPFLVTSDELLNRVVADSVAGDMLAGLEAIGVTGLALVPEGLRHVFSYGEPLRTAADFEGIAIRTPSSETSYTLFAALGAIPDDFDGIGGGELAAAIRAGTVNAMDSSFGGYVEAVPRSVVVGNVVPFPKANTLVVNSDVFAGLSDEQQDVLRQAAVATREWAIANNADDATRAESYCQDGGTIVEASESDLDALRNAAQSVYAELEGDDSTAHLIDRIRAVTETAASSPPIGPCTFEPETTPTTTIAVTESSAAPAFPDGVYRAEVTAERLIAAGVNRPDAFNHAGTWTLTFDEGAAIITDTIGELRGTCHGRYDVGAGRITVRLGDDPACGDAVGEVLFSSRWELAGDELQFVDVVSGHGFDVLIAALFGGTPFVRVG
jgi:TRAP-type C4-dicarboxylate transport system substrate-binding protein